MEFCVECGKEGCEIYEHLCEDCFRKKKSFAKIPEIIDVLSCTYCHAVMMGSRWLTAESVDAAVSKTILGVVETTKGAERLGVSATLKYQDKGAADATITVDVQKGSLRIKETHERKVRLKYGVCNNCTRHMRGYFESIIQIRGQDGELRTSDLDEAIGIIEDFFDRNEDAGAFVAKREAVQGGVDLYLSNTGAAREAAAILKDKYKIVLLETSKQAGMKDGMEIFRTTILVRIPKYHYSEFVAASNKVYRIMEIQKRQVKLIELGTGIVQYVKKDFLDGSRVIGAREAVFEAALVSESEKELQVMDPKTYATITFKRPNNYKVKEGSQSVKVIRYEDEMFLVQ